MYTLESVAKWTTLEWALKSLTSVWVLISHTKHLQRQRLECHWPIWCFCNRNRPPKRSQLLVLDPMFTNVLVHKGLKPSPVHSFDSAQPQQDGMCYSLMCTWGRQASLCWQLCPSGEKPWVPDSCCIIDWVHGRASILFTGSKHDSPTENNACKCRLFHFISKSIFTIFNKPLTGI